MCRRFAVPLSLIFGVMFSIPARAEVTICTAPGNQDQVAVAPGDSSVVVVWRDNRFDPANPYDIFASRRNYFLNPTWSSLTDGADECAASGSQTEPAVAIGPDGTTWMSWRDYRTCTAAGQVLVQAIAPGGSPLCSVNGTTITSDGCDDGMRSHTIISTSPGSAIVIWHHKYDTGIGGQTYDEILAQKLSTSGCARQWGNYGVVIANHGFGQASGTSVLIPYAVSDGSGGVLVVWYYASRLYARRVDSSGNGLWGGVRVCATEALQQSPSLAPDGSGGVIVTWQQGNAGSRTILAQRIDASGVLQWGSGGKVVSGTGGDLTNPQIARSTLGRSFVIWEADYAPPNSDIFAQRINVFGDTLAARIPICTALYGQTAPKAAAGPNGSCYIVWQDGRGAIGEDDIFAQKLDVSGNVLGPVDGCSFAGVPGSDDGTQSNPRIVPVEIGGSTTVPGAHALVVWSDTRAATSLNPTDIYAAPMSDPCFPGVLAVGPRTPDAPIFITNLPNPFSRSTKIRFQLAQQTSVALRVYDMGGRLVRVLAGSEHMGPGEHEVEWNGMTETGSRATPGVYFYRLTTEMQTQASHMLFLK